jgi:hypothetical protein
MERLENDLLFRWFVGIGVDAAVWDHSVSQRTATGFSKEISLRVGGLKKPRALANDPEPWLSAKN